MMTTNTSGDARIVARCELLETVTIPRILRTTPQGRCSMGDVRSEGLKILMLLGWQQRGLRPSISISMARS